MPDPQAARLAEVPDPVGIRAGDRRRRGLRRADVVASARRLRQRRPRRHLRRRRRRPPRRRRARARRPHDATRAHARTSTTRTQRSRPCSPRSTRFGTGRPVWTHAHRWTFAKPAAQHDEPFGRAGDASAVRRPVVPGRQPARGKCVVVGHPRRRGLDLTGARASVPNPMRLVVARCSVTYSGRLDAYLPEAVRLLMFKADGVGAGALRRRRLQAAELDDGADGDRGGRRHDHRPQGQGRGPADDRARRGHQRHDRRVRRRSRPREGRRRDPPAGAAGRRARVVRRGLPARAPRVADGHRARSTSCAATTRTAGSPSRSSASARSTRSSS